MLIDAESNAVSFVDTAGGVDLTGIGNAVTGEVLTSAVSDSLIHAGTRKVAVIGLSGVAVVDTPEALLVVPLDQSQEVRDVADQDQSD